MIRAVLWLFGALLLAAVVHIAVVLWIPFLAPASAFTVLYEQAPTERVALLDEIDETLAKPPFLDPYLPIAICRFDLMQGPHRIVADLESPYWAFSIHRANGTYFYGLTHSAAIEGKLAVELRDLGQTRELTVDPEADVSDVVQLSVPFETGFVIIRALAQTPSMRPGVMQALRETACGGIAAAAGSDQ